jgi:hypothetical protein
MKTWGNKNIDLYHAKLSRAKLIRANLTGTKEEFEAKLNEETTKSSEKVSENELSGPDM